MKEDDFCKKVRKMGLKKSQFVWLEYVDENDDYNVVMAPDLDSTTPIIDGPIVLENSADGMWSDVIHEATWKNVLPALNKIADRDSDEFFESLEDTGKLEKDGKTKIIMAYFGS